MARTGLLMLLLLALSAPTLSEERYTGPIIDMHLHAYPDEAFARRLPNPATGEFSVASADEHRRKSIELMHKHNVVVAVVDGTAPEIVEPWIKEFEGTILPGLTFQYPDKQLDIERFNQWVEAGKVQVFGEIGTTYGGYSPSDPVMAPYWSIAEEFDIPAGIHAGGSFPGIHAIHPNFRLRHGDPFLLEDVLVKYPDLRVYVMHAGGHFLERTAMLMVQYDELYVDIAVLNWLPNAAVFLEPFLKRAKEYDLLDRVMFGTDQMLWPEAIEMAIETIQALDFLTLEEKEGIFYANAARFLNLADDHPEPQP